SRAVGHRLRRWSQSEHQRQRQFGRNRRVPRPADGDTADLLWRRVRDQGQTTAILPNSYGDVYGTGPELRFGVSFALNSMSEVRGTFIWQSADADLVRLADGGSSPLSGPYSGYT